MSAFSKLFGQDRVHEAILRRLRGKPNGNKIIFKCVMCNDYKPRAGLFADDGVGINCFNCGFKTRFKMGEPLSNKMKSFLERIGVSSSEIAHLNYWAYTLHSMASSGAAPEIEISRSAPNFPARPLPDGARPIAEWAVEDCQDPAFLEAITYLYSRGEVLAEVTTYYWTPNTKHNINRRIIVPCMYEGRIVGWMGRATHSDIKPKYHKDVPQDFLFNADALSKPNRKVAIILEGTFDALVLDAVGIQNASINDKQAKWIEDSGKRIIALPDRDKAGARLIDIALDHGWDVSFPCPISVGSMRGWWKRDIKDATDAVKAYGQLYTLRSVIESATDNRMKINMMKKDFENSAK